MLVELCSVRNGRSIRRLPLTHPLTIRLAMVALKTAGWNSEASSVGTTMARAMVTVLRWVLVRPVLGTDYFVGMTLMRSSCAWGTPCVVNTVTNGHGEWTGDRVLVHD
jgi:hypothetical protein